MSLRVAWVSHQAAVFAVKRWHYSKSMPTPPVVKIGVWENGQFIGVVLFSRGASPALGAPYGLDATQVCELTRVALSEHAAAVSQVVAAAIRLLKQHSPGLRLIVSFADPNHNHHGGIYQAGNWIYTGQSDPSAAYVDGAGRRWHTRQVSATGVRTQYGQRRAVPKIASLRKVDLQGKHRYLMPLDRALRRRVVKLAQPYPRGRSVDGDAPGRRPGEAGSTPAGRSQT